MYNKFLKTFVEVAQKGSLSKASEALYLSTPGVMKQMNQLERELGLTLFNRSHDGIVLTKEGERILKESIFIMKYCDDVLSQLNNDTEYHIRSATSTLCPSYDFLKLCKNILKNHKQFKIDVIHLDEDKTNHIFDNLGKEYDIVFTLMDKDIWLENLQFLKVKDEPIHLMMNPNHILCQHDELEPYHLNNQGICLAKKGYSKSCDMIKNFIQKSGINTKIIDRSEYYDSSSFNKAMSSLVLYPAIDQWKNVNPVLQFIKVNWKLSIPVGAFYKKIHLRN